MQHVFKRTKQFTLSHRQFILYCLIGLLGIVIEAVTFAIAFDLLKWDKFAANFLSVFTSASHNFLLNFHFNFKVRNHILYRYAKYMVFASFGFAVSTLILAVCTSLLGLDTYFAKGISICVVVFVQYNLNRIITFRA